MTQLSVLGPILFSFHTTSLSKLIQNHPGISFYADNIQLYVHLTHKHVTEAFNRLKNCSDDIKTGFLQTSLILTLIRPNLFCLAHGLCMQNLGNFNIF